MLKSGVVAATLLAAALLVPTGTKPAEALTVTKPAVKDMTLKHDVRRFRRGFRGFRGRRFRGFRGRRFGGIRLGVRRGFRRGFRGRRFYRGRRFRRFYRPRVYYYGGPAVYYGSYRRGRCYHLKRRALYTGKRKWWRRYYRCKHYRGYYY